MEQTPHKYVNVAYELYTDNAKGIHELMEKATAEHPFNFITGMGVALDAFEQHIAALNEGDEFDFTLSVEEAYGPYEQEHVIELPKETFHINGKFDKEAVYPGAVLPLMNADGNRFDGLVLEVKDTTVVIDLNHPLAGKALHFKGQVTTMRDATDEELKQLIQMLSGEGGCSGCGGNCNHEDGEGCCGHGHEHGEGEGCCGGHGHGHGEGEGCCGGHGHGHGEGCCHHKD